MNVSDDEASDYRTNNHGHISDTASDRKRKKDIILFVAIRWFKLTLYTLAAFVEAETGCRAWLLAPAAPADVDTGVTRHRTRTLVAGSRI
jgi:hypothetical protein